MKTFFITLSLFICTNILAQKEDIQNLNNIFSKAYEFEYAKKGLRINFIKNDEVIRIEFFYLSEMNWETMTYSKEENGIVLQCQDSYPKCIDRKVTKTKSRRPYERTVLKVSDEKQAESAMEILRRFSDH